MMSFLLWITLILPYVFRDQDKVNIDIHSICGIEANKRFSQTASIGVEQVNQS